MNLKSIMTTAGVALLSFSLAGVSSAKPVTAPTPTVAAVAQDDPDDPDDCGFAYAVIYGPGCWVRVDQCGNETWHCYTASPFPKVEQTPAQASPTEAAVLPAWLKETD